MSTLLKMIATLNFESSEPYTTLTAMIEKVLDSSGYDVVEANTEKPWGGYFRLNSSQADEFVRDFFPSLSPEQARLGVKDAELSPKLLLVKPGERLSWQYHNRRAERWRFLTIGGYRKSATDKESEHIDAAIGEVVQFAKNERHRLEGRHDGYVLVAEIWQHTAMGNPSNEDDIVRLQDDYKR